MQLWLLGPLYAWLLPGALCWNKRISANLRNIAYAPERDYEWTRTAETKYYKRGGQTQVSPGNIPYFGIPKEDATTSGEEVEKSPENTEEETTKRAWAGPGDIPFYKRANVGSFGFYKRLQEAEEKKASPGSFSYYKRAGPGSFGMYKRGSPGSFGFYKRGSPGSFGFYKRAGPGAFAFYKRANPGDFGMYKRGSPGDFGMYKRSGPGSFALYKRSAEKNRRARPGDVPIWKRAERSTDEVADEHIIKKRSVGDFGFYKKSAKSEDEDKKELTKQVEKEVTTNEAKEDAQEAKAEEKPATCYHVSSFRCKLYYGDSPKCYHGGIGPRVSRDSNGALWCECACPEGWEGPECRVATL